MSEKHDLRSDGEENVVPDAGSTVRTLVARDPSIAGLLREYYVEGRSLAELRSRAVLPRAHPEVTIAKFEWEFVRAQFTPSEQESFFAALENPSDKEGAGSAIHEYIRTVLLDEAEHAATQDGGAFVGIGEVAWNLYPDGRRDAGGGALDFARWAHVLGRSAAVISAVGHDELGIELRSEVNRLGLSDEYIQSVPDLPTRLVRVAQNPDEQWSRTAPEGDALDRMKAVGPPTALTGCHAVHFGLSAQRTEGSLHVIQSLLEAAPRRSWIILDVEHDAASRDVVAQSLSAANVVRIDEHGLALLSHMFELTGSSRDQMAELARRYRPLVVVYMTAHESAVYLHDRWSVRPSPRSGRLDRLPTPAPFMAALAVAFIENLPIGAAHTFASDVAAWASAAVADPSSRPDVMRYAVSR